MTCICIIFCKVWVHPVLCACASGVLIQLLPCRMDLVKDLNNAGRSPSGFFFSSYRVLQVIGQSYKTPLLFYVYRFVLWVSQQHSLAATERWRPSSLPVFACVEDRCTVVCRGAVDHTARTWCRYIWNMPCISQDRASVLWGYDLPHVYLAVSHLCLKSSSGCFFLLPIIPWQLLPLCLACASTCSTCTLGGQKY